jgi:hypothetical protein
MNVTTPPSQSTWLKTDQQVIPVNPTAWEYLPEVVDALHHGVEATMDEHHPGFYEIEIGDHWYYIHVPRRLRAVYLVAAQNRHTSQSPEILQQAVC